MSRECTAEQFLKDVADHEMTVRWDSADLLAVPYRHLHFAQPKNSNMWFDIVTWPGVLTTHGDMGTWTFSRVPDMFNFFRDSEKLYINPHYWSEKLRMGAGSEGFDIAKDWDIDEFHKRVFEQLAQHFEDDPDRLAEVSEDLKDELSSADECEHEQRQTVYEYRNEDFYFDSTDIPDGKVWSYHYLWNCYAVVWAIQQYDALKVKPAAEVVA